MIGRVIQVVVPDPTFMNRLVAVVLASSSGIGAGGALSLSRVHLLDALHGGNTVESPWAYWRARVGFAISMGLIAYIVATQPVVNAGDWKVLLFTAGSVLAASGYGELTWRAFLKWRRESRK